MAEAIKARIGFVSGGAGSMPHYNSFYRSCRKRSDRFPRPGAFGKSLYEISDKKEIILRRVKDSSLSVNGRTDSYRRAD